MLVNANLNLFPDGFPILAGEYEDFTIEWYRVVGSTIILTLFLNVFTPHITNFMFNFIRMCKRCCDRGCHCDKSHTKQILQEDYEGIYIGPDFLLEFRYSSLLTNIFVSLMFGSGIPILYGAALLSFLFTYWFDKLFYLRVYKTPPRYDKSLISTVRSWINIAFIFHFVFGFWMYSNSSILESNESSWFSVSIASTTDYYSSDY